MAGGFSPINSRKLPIIVGLVAMAVFTFVAAETPSNVVAVMAISAAVFFAGGASGMSWALASVAAPAHCTASLGSIQNFGGYLGGALAPTVTGFIVQATGTFVPALLVGAVIALASALAYLVVIPNRPIRSAELGVAAPSARPSGALHVTSHAPDGRGLGRRVSLSAGWQLHLPPRISTRDFTSARHWIAIAMPNGRCRMHGGRSAGAPRGERNGNWRGGF